MCDFSYETTVKTVKNPLKQKKLQLEGLSAAFFICAQPYFASGRFRAARTEAAEVQPSKSIAMEFLNRIELRGVVGRADINVFNNSHVCNFSVVTECSVLDRDRNASIESTWFNVSAWNGVEGIEDLNTLKKGMWVRVVGRLRVRKYISQDNEERTSMDVLARHVEVLPRDDFSMQVQRD